MAAIIHIHTFIVLKLPNSENGDTELRFGVWIWSWASELGFPTGKRHWNSQPASQRKWDVELERGTRRWDSDIGIGRNPEIGHGSGCFFQLGRSRCSKPVFARFTSAATAAEQLAAGWHSWKHSNSGCGKRERQRRG